jgi:DNA-binding FrmR family transcriptional regulator
MQVQPAAVAAVTVRLNRAHGQLAGVLRMLQDGRDCADIVTQLAAASRALDKAGFALIAAGLEQCALEGENETVYRDRLQRVFLSLA